MKGAFRHFMAGLIDYAGLFPPAALTFDDAVRNHRRYLGEAHGWLLGRFVLPLARLGEMPGDTAFSLAVILPPDPAPEDLDGLGRFRGRIALLETRPPHEVEDARHLAAGLRELLRRLQPSGIDGGTLFVETAPEPAAIKAIADFNRELKEDTPIGAAGLKLRCGATGTAPPPSPETVAAAIGLCSAHDIPIKFTAGMHLPLRNRHPRTGQMQHGFLNIFAAALLARTGRLSAKDLVDCLRDEDPAAFLFSDEELRWRDRGIATANIQGLRRRRVASFGSCSFEEPVEGLLALGLLDPERERNP